MEFVLQLLSTDGWADWSSHSSRPDAVHAGAYFKAQPITAAAQQRIVPRGLS